MVNCACTVLHLQACTIRCLVSSQSSNVVLLNLISGSKCPCHKIHVNEKNLIWYCCFLTCDAVQSCRLSPVLNREKCLNLQGRIIPFYSVTAQKNTINIFTAMNTSNLNFIRFSVSEYEMCSCTENYICMISIKISKLKHWG
jgi:hypothetical protein